ncbi:GPO family capsid scaffolding protein [Pandoraea apista]|uniref:GPO family capsid scaffolding protein n=1 Tax=Pandoraea apista TaxID=93218 RepID=UPI000F67A5A3|nr:GPO family capsid scaffolding protein [Pandoraea apista]RRW94301.1 hypothetical protein EGJ54_18355 [Pandoraea apista]RRX00659.1 hypothetical protein EGJ56_19000 [Pandoraea apista]
MSKKSKFFVVATEGDTTDGRKIDAAQITQMAGNYDPVNKYGARVNMEHIKGLYPDSPFRAYGDVVALKTQKNAEGKLQLLAQIDPTDDLVKMTNQDRQKVYTSIEIAPNFANSGEAYLYALAVTDNPASLGTEMLKFSSSATNSPLAARKQAPENLFTAALPFTLELEDEADVGNNGEVTMTVKGSSSSIIERFTAALFGQKPTPTTPPAKTPDAATKTQEFTAEAVTKASAEAVAKAMEQFSGNLTAAMQPVADAMDKLRSDHDALVQKLSDTDNSAQRAAATGGSQSVELTDF